MGPKELIVVGVKHKQSTLLIKELWLTAKSNLSGVVQFKLGAEFQPLTFTATTSNAKFAIFSVPETTHSTMHNILAAYLL